LLGGLLRVSPAARRFTEVAREVARVLHCDADFDAACPCAISSPTVPDSPEIIAAELRIIAETCCLEGIAPEDTIEWDAAAKLETAARALREIRDGGEDPRAVAAVALMSISG
jgi:hypothetical protein